MKKIYRLCIYSSFNNEEWQIAKSFSNLCYKDENSVPEDIIVDFHDFDTAFEYLKTHHCYVAYNDMTLIRKKPLICYHCYPDEYVLERESFKPFKQKCTFEEVTDFSFYTLMKYLSADDFVEYCKDKGLNICSFIDKGETI